MRRVVWRFLAAAMVALPLGCTGEAEPEPEPPPEPPAGCAPGEASLPDGSCLPAGIPPDGCGEGFEADEADGCVAILPAAPCPTGQMAMVGEASCREVAPCGDGAWGEAPLDADTQYVDGSYPGGDSDGSAEKPWTSVQAAIDAAADGALIAIAAGSYVETLDIASKAVRLWGRCPGMVELVGDDDLTTVFVRREASGTEFHDLAIRGPAAGVTFSGSSIRFERVWIHDTGWRGIDGDDIWGETDVTVSRSLIEHATQIAIGAFGTSVRIEESVIRDTVSPTGGDGGTGIEVVWESHAAMLEVSRSLFERHHLAAIILAGAEADIRDTLIRDTLPRESDDGYGYAIAAQQEDGGRPSVVRLHSSVLAGSHEATMLVSGSEATIENTVMRDTEPRMSDQGVGRGLAVQNSIAGDPSTALIRGSLFARHPEMGIMVGGSQVTIESTRVYATRPRVVDKHFGRGVAVRNFPSGEPRAAVTLTDSVVDSSFDVAVSVLGSDLVIDHCHVRHTEPREADGGFGDGLAATALSLPAGITVRSSLIEGSARAGIGAFGGSVWLSNTQLECNRFPLNGEVTELGAAAFVDEGGNTCGCRDEPAVCQVLSSSLEPPEPPQDI